MKPLKTPLQILLILTAHIAVATSTSLGFLINASLYMTTGHGLVLTGLTAVVAATLIYRTIAHFREVLALLRSQQALVIPATLSAQLGNPQTSNPPDDTPHR